MNALEEKLLAHIGAHGPLTFAGYMAIALYDPDYGYYSGGAERTGRGGDFLTSPELDPAFGILWARGLEEIWDGAGRPSPFDIVEVGPGEGGFAAALLDAASGGFADALRLTLVEMAAPRRARQVARLGAGAATWAGDIEGVDPVADGCIFLNEVLDNQPVHALRFRDGEVLELHVAAAGGTLVELWQPCADDDLISIASRASDLPAQTIEISPRAAGLAAACASLVEKGAVIFVDYGREGAELAGDSLVTFSSSGPGSRLLEDPGTRDITAHVDWMPVRRALVEAGYTPFGPHRQRSILQALGAAELDDDLSTAHRDSLSRGHGAAAVRALSRRQALRALLDPAGLGHLQVLAGTRGIEAPGFLRAFSGC